MKNIASTFKKSASPLYAWACAAVVMGLSACGGGGSSEVAVVPPPPPPPVVVEPSLSLTTLQGRWATASGDVVARWLPPAPGQTAAPVWMLSKDGQFLTVLNATVSGSSAVVAKGKRYQLDLQTGQGAAQSIDWQGVANVKATPAFLNFAGGPSLTLTEPLKDAALQLNAVGHWHSNLGLTTLDFQVDALGVITGQSQTGCIYVGVLNARTDVSVYEAKLSETCAGNQVQQFTGIAVLSSSATANINQLTLALVSADAMTGKALYFQRQ